MQQFVTERDLALKSQIFPYISERKIPLSFCYGGRIIEGIPGDYAVCVTEEKVCADILRRNIAARNEDGLEIHIEQTEYLDFPATEWMAYFVNRGAEATDVISDIRIGGILPMRLDAFGHSIGDDRTADGFDWKVDPLTKAYTFSPKDGTSCNGAFPYMRLLGDHMGINLAFGWSGRWIAELEPVAGGVRISAGQARCRMRILPGETIRTPRLTCVAYAGSEEKGRNMWRRWYLAHILPPVKPMCCMHYFREGDWPEFTGATEQGQLNALETYLRRGIRPDVLWMDAGWYPCNHRWSHVGDWQVDRERFPNGLAPIGERCARENIGFLLWFEPERTMLGSPLERAHPEWIQRLTKEDGSLDTYGLTNLADPECCQYIIDLLDGIIKEAKATIYRQDYNFVPAPGWENEEADRIGALENLHIQGYYRLLDELRERNPGLLIDICAAGGRRNDLETMRRAVALHYTDVGYGIHPIKQKQHRLMFEWIPYFRAHAWSWDNKDTQEYETGSANAPELDSYAFYAALAPAITDMLDHRASEERYALSRKMQPIWRKAAERMLKCDYFPLTECKGAAEDFYAMAFYSPEEGSGFLNIVSNNANPDTTITVALPMLEADACYMLTEAETGTGRSYSGGQLISGMRFEMPKRSGMVIFIDRCKA